MASRIKGITVEIGGDTTKLEQSLKSVNSTIKSTQSQLKDVTKLLKLDPKNTELLSQKQRILKDAVQATKEKLEALKEAQVQAKQQLENGDLGQDKYDALQREIVETEEELRRLEQEAQNATSALSKIDEAGKKLEQVGDKMTSAGKKMLPVTAAITGIGTAAVKTTADFDSSMSQVSAISGATAEDLDALRDKAREMGSKTKFSASEAADAMSYMAMAGWKTEDMLDGISGVMDLAAASGEDLATTSDIVTDALTAFGLTISDLDMENRVINIDHQLQRLSDMRLVIEATKTNAGTRKLPMTDEVYSCFQAILEDRPKPKIEKMVEGYSGFLYLDKEGLPLVALHWEHRMKSMVDKYNRIYRVQMPRITPHVCRHTYCSNMAKAGMNPKTLQYLMGHSDIGVTLNIYTHLGLEDAAAELKRLEDLKKAQAEMEKMEAKENPVSKNMFRAI